jgi:hypothetical protein
MYQFSALKKRSNPPSSPFVKRRDLSPPFRKGRLGGILQGNFKQLKCYVEMSG